MGAREPTQKEYGELEREFVDRNLEQLLFDILDKYDRRPPHGGRNHVAVGWRSSMRALKDLMEMGRVKSKTLKELEDEKINCKRSEGLNKIYYGKILQSIWYIRNSMHQTI